MKHPSPFTPRDRRALSSRAAILVLVAAIILAIVVVGRAVLRGRSRPSAADWGAPDMSIQADADAAREHNAEVLFGRAKIAASMRSWRSARENLARLRNEYPKTSFFKINQPAIAELAKTIEEALRSKPPSAEAPPDAAPAAPAEPIPETPRDLHALLRAKNPNYTGRGRFSMIRNRFVGVGMEKCNIVDLSPLRGLALKYMRCAHNQITDLAPLRGMALEYLDCRHNQIADLAPLAGMPLAKLFCGHNRIADLSPLRGIPLRCLDCSGNKVADLAPLKGMPLRRLDCSENPITDLSPLHGLSLRSLECMNTRVTEVAPLSGMRLEQIGLAGLAVRDLSGLLHTPVRTLAFTPELVEKTLPSLRKHKTLRTIGFNCKFKEARMPVYNFWLQRDARSGKHRLAATLTGHQGAVFSVTFSSDGDQIASASADRTIRLWDASTGKCTHTLEGHSDEVRAVAFTPDGKRLLSASAEGTLRSWDPSAGKCLKTLKAQDEPLSSLAFSPDGKRIVTGGRKGTLKLWDAAALKHLATLKGHPGNVGSVAFSPDGSRIAATFPVLTLWNADTGELLRTLSNPGRQVDCGVFSPGGKRIVTGGHALLLWDAATGRRVGSLDVKELPILCVVFSPDGTRLASGSGHGTVALWDLATGKCLANPEAHAYVSSVAFSPDGSRIASGSGDHTVKIWAIGPPDPIELHRLDEQWRKQSAVKLSKRISFDFVETPAQDVMAFMSSLADVTIILDPRAVKDEPRSVTLRVNDMSLKHALKWVCKLVGLVYEPRDEALFVTTAALAKETQELDRGLRARQRPPRDDADARLRMSSRISFDFVETPVQDVTAFLMTMSGQTIILDGGPVGERPLPVTLRVNDMRFDLALRWVCFATGLTYVWHDGAVLVGRPERLDQILRQDKAFAGFQEPPTIGLATKMAKTIHFDFVGMALRDALAVLGDRAGVAITIDPRVAKDQETPSITLQSHGMRIHSVVRWVCRLAGMVCLWRDGKIVVTTPERARKASRGVPEEG